MKILYTNGYGAGWSTWNSRHPAVARFIATYPPLIARVEERRAYIETLLYRERQTTPVVPPDDDVLIQLLSDVEARWGNDVADNLYLGGAETLDVEDVDGDGPVVITENDGCETVRPLYSDGVVVFAAGDDSQVGALLSALKSARAWMDDRREPAEIVPAIIEADRAICSVEKRP